MRTLERAFFEQNGFVLIRDLLTAEQALEVSARASSEAGLSPESYATEADAANRFPVALDTLTRPEMADCVRGIMGQQVKFLQLSDLHQNHNSFNWHRDSVH